MEAHRQEQHLHIQPRVLKISVMQPKTETRRHEPSSGHRVDIDAKSCRCRRSSRGWRKSKTSASRSCACLVSVKTKSKMTTASRQQKDAFPQGKDCLTGDSINFLQFSFESCKSLKGTVIAQCLQCFPFFQYVSSSPYRPAPTMKNKKITIIAVTFLNVVW